MSSSNGSISNGTTTPPPTLVATLSSLNGASTPPPSYLAVTKQNGTASNTSKVSTKTSHSSTTSEVSIKS
ncbi:hypothetical protein BT96DRAFT_1001648 [Gymnopus androsaceus JB14]|uniref:Uncharacterized protein n=1 Tax=Gymnopus androsaceus JB14 TaxID=1447944 RepID=A0A6A4H170_9AGAR|nr:hypothetical protein BT96DRAFT_1001648 [Gymnopus androsaceus JB14]